MLKNLIILLLFFYSSTLAAQYTTSIYSLNNMSVLPEAAANGYSSPLKAKLYQRNHGMIIGLQRGYSTAIELGAEAHWRKLALKKPNLLAATANMEYHFKDHIIGYKAGMWTKRGRVNLTYGANLLYFTDFKGSNWYGVGPSVGFRLMGLHLVNGYNFLAKGKQQTKEGMVEAPKVNTLYLSLRYYFSMDNKYQWQNKEKDKRKKERVKEKRAKEKARAKGNDDGKGKKILGIQF